MSKIGLIAFAATMLMAGVSYAGEKVMLVCSGTVYFQDWRGRDPGLSPIKETMPYPQDGLAIDVDGGTVTWGGDTFPVTENKGNLITFQGDIEDQLEWHHFRVRLRSRHA